MHIIKFLDKKPYDFSYQSELIGRVSYCSDRKSLRPIFYQPY